MHNNLNNQFNMLDNEFQNPMFKKSYSSSHLTSTIKNSANGLQNIDANGYMNAIIQCLAHAKNLTTILLNNRKEIKRDKYKKKLTNSFVELLENLWKKDLDYYIPYNFKELIYNMNPLLAEIRANDSKYLISFLLEKMHNELNKAKNVSHFDDIIYRSDFIESFQSFKKYYENNFQSIISDIFYGIYDSKMKCLNCNIITHNFQTYDFLIFTLEAVYKYKNRMQKYVTIRECFEYFQKLELMIEQKQIYCNNCKHMANCINNISLLIAPKILIINVKREKGIKFDIKLDFTEYLNIYDFLFFKDNPFKYKLIGVVSYFNTSKGNEHFIAFCRSLVNDQWYRYDDAIVSSSSFLDARDTGVPYLLFYQGEDK